jgi:hypothetical protein
MHTYRPEREQWMPQPVDVVLSFFSRPENLQVITALGLYFRMVETLEALAAGSMEPAARICGPPSSGALCAVEPRALVYLARRRHDDARSSDLCTAFGVGGDDWLPGR